MGEFTELHFPTGVGLPQVNLQVLLSTGARCQSAICRDCDRIHPPLVCLELKSLRVPRAPQTYEPRTRARDHNLSGSRTIETLNVLLGGERSLLQGAERVQRQTFFRGSD